VLNLMKRLQADHGLTYIVISHDMAVVKYMADRIGVMYLGKLVEIGSGEDIYKLGAAEEPELRSFGPGHLAACHFPLQKYAAEAPAAEAAGSAAVCMRVPGND